MISAMIGKLSIYYTDFEECVTETRDTSAEVASQLLSCKSQIWLFH